MRRHAPSCICLCVHIRAYHSVLMYLIRCLLQLKDWHPLLFSVALEKTHRITKVPRAMVWCRTIQGLDRDVSVIGKWHCSACMMTDKQCSHVKQCRDFVGQDVVDSYDGMIPHVTVLYAKRHVHINLTQHSWSRIPRLL
jgi:hypothetical protein